MWKPVLPPSDAPIYARIAAALENDVKAGVLAEGARMPTLKELAAFLGVTPGTVNRAYELAHRRGLVDGEVGRGTFVSGSTATRLLEQPPKVLQSSSPIEASNEWVELSKARPNPQLQESYVRAGLQELAQSPMLAEMLDYKPDGDHPLHRQAGALWVQEAGFQASAETVLLTAGAQHGLWVAINALTRPGDIILCESLCYPGIASIVNSLGRRLKGINLDDKGMRVDHLREVCKDERPAMAIIIANCQNPTSCVMPEVRRKEIAEVAREFDFILVDDDIYSFLTTAAIPPLSNFAPERSLYITSLSKCVLPTLRIGYLSCPPEWLARLAANVRTNVSIVSPLAAQLATQLIMSGGARELANAQREEARSRQQIARELLDKFEYLSLDTSYQIWLKLPSTWASGDQFASLARGYQMIVASGDTFSMNRDGEGRQYVRINLMGQTRTQMQFTLTKLVGLIDMPDTPWL